MWRPAIAPRTKKAEAAPSDVGNEMPDRLRSLDALRGLAALAVVFWHWQHFFYHGTTPQHFDRSSQPFYSVFFLFYEKGWMGVDFFFCLSGFIFFWLYAQRITKRRIGLSDFSVLRLSRLYPLHLATLLIVAVLQWRLLARTGEFFVYSLNDGYHFLLNLLFISGWRTSFGDSFNAPVWSVSVEMFLYALFFALCVAGRPGWFSLLSLAVMGALLKFYTPIGRGIYCFFLGGAAYYTYEMLFVRKLVLRALKPLGVLVVVGWAAIVIGVKIGVPADSPGAGNAVLIGRAINLVVTGVLMPMTILLLAVAETVRNDLGKRFGFLGDISYSSYLLHFPLQLLAVTSLGLLGVAPTFYYRRSALVGFFVLLLTLSLLTYRYFERPLQDLIRRRWRESRGRPISLGAVPATEGERLPRN